jgi:hypothetical protein
MTYEQFIHKGTEFYMNMVKLIDIKFMYRMELTDDEKEIQEHILEFQKQVKLTELRDKFEKCWEVDEDL